MLTGEARVVLNRRDLSRALAKRPGVTSEQARQFARARIVDRCRAAGGATGAGLFLLRFLDDLYVWNADRERLQRLTRRPAFRRTGGAFVVVLGLLTALMPWLMHHAPAGGYLNMLGLCGPGETLL